MGAQDVAVGLAPPSLSPGSYHTTGKSSRERGTAGGPAQGPADLEAGPGRGFCVRTSKRFFKEPFQLAILETCSILAGGMFLRQGLGQDDEWVKGEGRAAG